MFKESRTVIVDILIAMAIVGLYSPGLLALRPTDPSLIRSFLSIGCGLGLLDLFVYENIIRHTIVKRRNVEITTSDDALSKMNPGALNSVDAQKVFYSTINDTKDQLERMKRNGKMIYNLLDDRFGKGSLTFEKFYSAYEASEDAMLDNTRNIMTRMQLFDAKSFLRLKSLIETNAYRHDNIPDDLQMDQYELYIKNINQIKDLVGLNEALLIKIEQLGMEVAAIDTDDSEKTNRLVAEIESLIGDIEYYKN
ncbi:MAG: hypothetical protein J6P61_05550 [Erysipelotrichaceae bacterium]|nr:hypothetical protein [Erysipelotrichaceae bacterium]